MAKAATSAEPSMEEILASIRRIISDESGQKAVADVKAVVKGKGDDVTEKSASAASGHVSEEDLDKLFATDADVASPADADEHISAEDLDKLFASDDGDAEPETDVADEVLDLGEVATVEEPTAPEALAPEETDLVFADPDAGDVPDAPADATPEPAYDAVAEIEEELPVPEAEPEPIAPRPAPKASARPAERGRSRAEDVDGAPLLSEASGASIHAAFGELTHTILSANARTLDDLVKDMLRPMLRAWLDENLPAIVERLVRAEIERVSRGR